MSGSCSLSEVRVDTSLGKGGGTDGEREKRTGLSPRKAHGAGSRGRILRGPVLSLTGGTIFT